eukprot:1716416-Lingulodinium_polyedra.AAC.1
MLKGAAKSAGCLDLLSVPHQLRHGGPSHDALFGPRDIATIQGRGRWRAGESARVYEKHGSLHRQRAKLRGEVVAAAK